MTYSHFTHISGSLDCRVNFTYFVNNSCWATELWALNLANSLRKGKGLQALDMLFILISSPEEN